jgi:glycosyltransferase involved in cell wall biosynthesis
MSRDTTKRPVVLAVVDYYLPGFKGGGPIRTIANLVERLGDAFDFRILTRDRDLGDAVPYSDVTPGEWTPVGAAQVLYLAPDDLGRDALAARFSTIDYDVLYLNSFFSTISVKLLWLRRRGRLPQRPVIIAPRGEFYPGALALKAAKKSVYLRASRLGGLTKNVIWLASTPDERATILSLFPAAADRVRIAANLAPAALPQTLARRSKVPGEARLVFLSRLSPKKNLDYALDVLARPATISPDEHITFDIYGPQEDPAYWAECQKRIDRLPDGITAAYRGAVKPERVAATLAGYDAFYFPTRGENYGHVIHEALAAGTLVLISDRTPWRNLAERGTGWDISLDEPETFTAAIRELVMMDNATFMRRSSQAKEQARAITQDAGALVANRELFLDVLER